MNFVRLSIKTVVRGRVTQRPANLFVIYCDKKNGNRKPMRFAKAFLKAIRMRSIIAQPFTKVFSLDFCIINLKPNSPSVRIQSVQRESNPHFRPGKAAGYRYIMDAIILQEYLRPQKKV